MTDEKDLTPQEPGAESATSKIDALADGTVGDLAEAVDQLTGDELRALHAAEVIGKNRSTALGVIQRELERREFVDGATVEIEGASKADLGDRDSYSRMAGKEVDPAGLERPVLTRDGWVLPAPAAKPKV